MQFLLHYLLHLFNLGRFTAIKSLLPYKILTEYSAPTTMVPLWVKCMYPSAQKKSGYLTKIGIPSYQLYMATVLSSEKAFFS